jgi:predicted AAA+ superfamily ATPase
MSGHEGVDGRLLRGILYDNLGINEGMFFENAVAQTLTACGVELLFYSAKDFRCPERTMEVDFLFRNGIKISPIEVKSSRCREHVSLDRFIAAYSKRLGLRYVITANSHFSENGIEYLPIYMAHLIVPTVSVCFTP